MGCSMDQPNQLGGANQGSVINPPPLSMLYPLGTPIHHELDLNDIRKFLWKGGRSKEKKYHLVNWKMVRNPKDQGGLGIRDSTLMNVAMGENMSWRIISEKLEWWKKVLWKKNFKGSRLICVELPLKEVKGSTFKIF
jgi:hypothetical protein